MSPVFSVVICTYNGGSRLPDLLDRLRSQQPPSFSWEVLIVDNNSQDNTAQVVQQQQQTWAVQQPTVPLRYAFEPRQGLAYARRCALQRVQGEWVGFLDDDTLPDSDWVAQAVAFAQQHPEAGAFGSDIRAQYEVPPPAGFERIASGLAIVQRGDRPFCYQARYGSHGVLPAGAGMVIRRQAWLDCVPPQPVMAGVRGDRLDTKGEDVETLSYLSDRGWPIWHNPAMRLTHQIPQTRLAADYLLHLFRCIGLSRYPLRRLRYRVWQQPLMLGLHGLNDLRRLVLHLLKTGQLRPTDTVTACERALLVYSLVSPIYGLWSSRDRLTYIGADS